MKKNKKIFRLCNFDNYRIVNYGKEHFCKNGAKRPVGTK